MNGHDPSRGTIAPASVDADRRLTLRVGAELNWPADALVGGAPPCP